MRVTLGGTSSQLSPRDQVVLKEVLEGEKYDFVPNDLFKARNVEKKIFDEAPPIALPDTNWYHPLMENIDSGRGSGKNTGAVRLTAAEERALFFQFNYCRYRVAQLRRKLLKAHRDKPDSKPARELLHWHHKTSAYRDQIARTNLALVLAMAKRTRMSDIDFADLVSEGNMALLRAVDKFDAGRGFKFSTYACRAILKAFSRMGVKLSRYRQLFPTDFDPNLERSDYMQHKRTEEAEQCADEIRLIVNDNLARLSEIEQEVIGHRFAVGHNRKEEPSCEPLTLEQVGRIIGVTKERVRQIQNKALLKIRKSLESGYLC